MFALVQAIPALDDDPPGAALAAGGAARWYPPGLVLAQLTALAALDHHGRRSWSSSAAGAAWKVCWAGGRGSSTATRSTPEVHGLSRTGFEALGVFLFPGLMAASSASGWWRPRRGAGQQLLQVPGRRQPPARACRSSARSSCSAHSRRGNCRWPRCLRCWAPANQLHEQRAADRAGNPDRGSGLAVRPHNRTAHRYHRRLALTLVYRTVVLLGASPLISGPAATRFRRRLRRMRAGDSCRLPEDVRAGHPLQADRAQSVGGASTIRRRLRPQLPDPTGKAMRAQPRPPASSTGVGPGRGRRPQAEEERHHNHRRLRRPVGD